MSSKQKYRKDIQALRGLAVLAVVLFHAKESYFPLGYLGVDVFFVISGFVVTPLIIRIFTEEPKGETRLRKLRNFYVSRYYRLAPALAMVLSISAVAILLLGYPAEHESFARQGIATLLLVGNLGAYIYSGDYFSPNPNPLVHTWSLSVEEQIYIFLPLLLMLILLNRMNIKKVTLIVFSVITSASFITFLVPALIQPLYTKIGISDSLGVFSFYSPFTRIWQFTLGGLGYFLLQRRTIQEKYERYLSPILILGIVFILFISSPFNLRFSSVIASLIAIVMIILKSLDLLPSLLITKLEWLGDRSYSIYLIHMPLLYLAKYSPVTQIGDGSNRIVQSMVAVVATILLGSISYSQIENRFRVRGASSVIRKKTICISLIMTLITPLTLFVLMDRGASNQYWGLEAKIPQLAPYAGSLDPECDRISEIGPPCIYKIAGATRTVLLIGDSHAAHVSQALIDAAKSKNWNVVVWTHGGCHVQFERSVGYWPVSNNCLKINLEMKDWVNQNKPNAIIVSQFVHSDSSQDVLRNALSTLQLIVPNILLIQNNPIFPDDRDFMVSRPLIMRSPYNPPKTFAISKMQTKDLDASNELGLWARDNGMLTMDFSSLFCDRKICTRYSSAGWLYFDINHFSVAGAALTIPQFESYLMEIQNQ